MSTNNPYQSPQQSTAPDVVPPPGVNRIGLAGLVVSLVAWGIVAIVLLTALLGFAKFFAVPTGLIVLGLGLTDLLLSIIGLFRQPRGAAIAAFVLSCALATIVCGGALVTTRTVAPAPAPQPLQVPWASPQPAQDPDAEAARQSD